MKITKRQLTRIIKEEKRRLNEQGGLPGKSGAHSDAAVEKAKSVIEQQLNSLYHNQMLENADLIVILEQMIKDINSGFVGEPT
jgi:hypothetical protein